MLLVVSLTKPDPNHPIQQTIQNQGPSYIDLSQLPIQVTLHLMITTGHDSNGNNIGNLRELSQLRECMVTIGLTHRRVNSP